LVVGAILAGSALLPRWGARTLAVAGLVVAASGAASFTFIDSGSAYASAILPGLVVAGTGFGLIFGPAMNLATLGVRPDDSGAALLNTIAVGAPAAHRAADPETTDSAVQSLIHGNTVAYWATSAILLSGALVCGMLIRPRRVTPPAGSSDSAAVASS